MKLFVREPESESVRAYLGQHAILSVTSITFAEALGVLKSKWLRKDLSQELYLAACEELVVSVFGGTIQIDDSISLTERETFNQAEEFCNSYRLDIADALQLVALKRGFFSRLSGESRPIMVTADSELATAGEMTKNGEERIVVLNRIARSVVESERGKHRECVFTYNGERIVRINNHAWRKARSRAGLPLVRMHDLRHTFGNRLRAAGVSFEDRQDLLGHRSGRITTHYSAPDLSRLLHAPDSICEQKRATVLRLAGGVQQNPGKIPAVSNAAKSSALVS